MNHPIKLPGFESQTIEVQPAGFLSGPQLLVNGQPAPKGPQRGQLLLRRNDGREVIATWKPQALGFDLPQLVVDGQNIQIVEPLKITEWIWGGLPVFLIFIGGFLGALAGVIAFTINIRVFRSDMNILLKFLLTGVISALAVVVYFIAATLFLTALGR
jgi:hypothetical protein